MSSSLIVLYAVPFDAINVRTSAQLANDIFGINTTEVEDPVNARSHVLRCSKKQLDYRPACGTVEQSCFNQPSLIVNGVLEVPLDLDQNVTGVASGTVKNWVEAKAQVMLSAVGIDLFAFTQIMHVIPDAASCKSQ